MKKPNLPIVVIAGPTASGKSATALELAQKIGGEILCADSRTIYKDASIGTAKPNADEQQNIKHYGLDLVNLGESFTVHDFKIYAQSALGQIRSKNKIPIIVGGSGLYIDGLVYDFSFLPSSDPVQRSKLNNLSVNELQTIIKQQNLQLPTNSLNKRHLIRVIETKGQTPKKKSLPNDVIYTGLLPSDEQLKDTINARVDTMYNSGFLDEVNLLNNLYSPEQISSAGIGYQSALAYINGQVGLKQAKQLFKQGDWQLARRQKTWFKRNPDIIWFTNNFALQTHILDQLNK